jgi:DNA polymerase-3 subunit alpha
VISFDEIGRKLWVRFDTMRDFKTAEQKLMQAISESEGRDQVVLYIAEGKLKKELPAEYNVKANEELLSKLYDEFVRNNIKVV